MPTTVFWRRSTDIIETDKFSEVSLSNVSGSNGIYYGVPKDKDTVGLVYNKEMFDAAGVSYPTADWTWDDLVSASEKIYEATGKYGYMAYADDQLGYWNFVYQAGSYILNGDKTQAGFTQPATMDAMKFYIGYDAVLLLSGIQNISKSLYESAALDGASKVKQFFTITLPMVPMVLLYLLFQKQFIEGIAMTGGK